MTPGLLLKDNCKFELCPVCMFPEFPVDLQLRGVCLASPVEKFYLLHNSTELHGHGGSVLSWAAPEQIWRIRTSNFQSLVTLQSGGGGGDLPLGNNQWHFSDSDCSDPGKQIETIVIIRPLYSPLPGQTSRSLSLHVAAEQPGHFCCGDGLCLSSNMVCDGNQDCADRSDERTCTMVMVGIENISVPLTRKYFSFSH